MTWISISESVPQSDEVVFASTKDKVFSAVYRNFQCQDEGSFFDMDDELIDGVIRWKKLPICKECNKPHGFVLEDSRTNEIVEEMEYCPKCFWKKAFSIKECE